MVGARMPGRRPAAPPRLDAPLEAGAELDGPYRYRLWRHWRRDAGAVLFVMLNPSTADAHSDDPTLRRCLSFARRWGYGGVEVVNLFAWRATDPRQLTLAPDPIGPRNDSIVAAAAAAARAVVVAWGAGGALGGRDQVVAALLRQHQPRCLGVTAAGAPRHPLYVRADQRRLRWPRPGPR